MKLNKIAHIAIIVSNYAVSKHFYVDLLGFSILQETYREEKESYKLDLALQGEYIIELFSFPHPPKRVTSPEATGLRHIAFEVDSIKETVKELERKGIYTEEVRVDPLTKKIHILS